MLDFHKFVEYNIKGRKIPLVVTPIYAERPEFSGRFALVYRVIANEVKQSQGLCGLRKWGLPRSRCSLAMTSIANRKLSGQRSGGSKIKLKFLCFLVYSFLLQALSKLPP